MALTFTMSPDVSAMFPDAQIRFVAVTGLANSESWPRSAQALQGLEEDVAAGRWAPFQEDGERIGSWHEAYRKFGTNPRRIRSSADALGRRLAKSGRLPRINGAVDSYNYVSARFGTPSGAFDMSRLTDEVVIRTGAPGDEFTPLGEPEVIEAPKPGEVVYAMGSQILTRHWNHRDCDQTKVDVEATAVVFMIERVSAAATPDEVLDQAQQALLDLVAEHAEDVTAYTLDASRPSVTFG
jgi:DNA/RNA-binding domain of Phe-tRNA-synthetase-like protein